MREALRAGFLPPAFLYDSHAQAERWLAYHRAWSPSRRDPEVRALYGQAFTGAAGELAGGVPRLIGLGCGDGQKDAEAIAALLARAAPAHPARTAAALHYVPIDASAPLVGEAALMLRARFPGIAIHPLAADLSAEPELLTWIDAESGPVGASLLTCFGMLPNLDVACFARYVAGLLAPRDRLLISANLSPGGYAADRDRVLPQYDNAEARDWYTGALAELGLEKADTHLTINAEAEAEDGSAWRIAVEALTRPGLALGLFGESVTLPAEGRLRLFSSRRFTAAAARALLERAGLAVWETWIDRTGEEGIFLCMRAN
jgi:uncharacterized SAM-dependent methyltransferase